MRRFKARLASALQKKKHDIRIRIKKAGIKTLQDVLNTNILGSETKINYIRHTYTCYDQYMHVFNTHKTGLKLRAELNNFISELVAGKHTIAQLHEYNDKIKKQIKILERELLGKTIEEEEASIPANDNLVTIEEVKDTVKETIETKEDWHYIDPPTFTDLSEGQQHALSNFPKKILRSDMHYGKVRELCFAWIKEQKKHWQIHYKYIVENNPDNIDRYIVEMFLENRNEEIYPVDFSDLDYLLWREVKEKAYNWLKRNFTDEEYTNFIENILPNWIKKNSIIHVDKILEKLTV